MDDKRHADTEPEADLLDHEYDGIQEYDNPTPGWWKWLFLATFVWGLGYTIHYGIGKGPSVAQNYTVAVRIAAEKDAQRALAAGEVTEDVLAKVMASPSDLSEGQAVFVAKCQQCHGARGEGLIGPNLTDSHYIHGRRLKEIYVLIRDGAVAKGMAAWGKQLKPEELLRVSAFVGSLRDTNIPGKAPQGEALPPEMAATGWGKKAPPAP